MAGKKKTKQENAPIVVKPKKVRKTKKSADVSISGVAMVEGTPPTEHSPIKDEKPCCDGGVCEIAPTNAKDEPTPTADAPHPVNMKMKIIVFVQSFGNPLKFLHGNNPRLFIVENLKKAFFSNDIIDRLGRDTLLPVEKNTLANASNYVNHMQKRGYTVFTRAPTAEEMKEFGL